MVKRYDRGGAGAGQVPLEDIRPPPILRVHQSTKFANHALITVPGYSRLSYG